MKVVIILSGGMDSTVLLHHHLQHGDEVRALGVDYGQRHSKELKFAMRTANKLDVPFSVANLSSLRNLLPGSSQTDDGVPVPEGHYAEENMRKTVVPNRNMIMLAVAAGHAIAHGYEAVSYAAHSGDHAVYPDCREEFAEALSVAVGLCDWDPPKLMRPFVDSSKADIVGLGVGYGVDFSETWSCYKGREYHCGRCGTCIERREAFYLAGVKDPTVYDTGAPTVEELVKNDWRL